MSSTARARSGIIGGGVFPALILDILPKPKILDGVNKGSLKGISPARYNWSNSKSETPKQCVKFVQN